MIGGLFIDGPNLIHSLARAEKPGARRRIDFNALPLVLSRLLSPAGARPHSIEHVEFVHKHYYGGFRHERDKMRLKDFNRMLENLAYTVHESRTQACRKWKTCPTCTQAVPEGHTFYLDKETDIGLALDAVQVANHEGGCQVICVVSNDGDFAALFRRLPRVRRVVVGWSAEMARELPMVAQPIYLDEVLEDILYHL